MSTYKVGMIGLGHFARQFIPLFKAHPLVGEVVLCELRKDVLDSSRRSTGSTARSTRKRHDH
jgi:hypothetical protein